MGNARLAKLDDVTVAGSIDATAQRDLASVAPFAEHAYKCINDEEWFISLLLDIKTAEKVIECSSDNRTKGLWIEHLRKLRSFKVTDHATSSNTTQSRLFISTYFAILKANGLARTIFSGGALSRLFRRPPPVCLPSLPLVLSIISDILRGKKFFFLTADLRHFFHQLAVCGDIQKYFSVHCQREVFFFLNLVMGWSYSPRIAQSMAWAALLFFASAENGLEKSAKEFLALRPENPPGFMLLHDTLGRVVGLILIWYDNYLAWTTDADVGVGLSNTMKAMDRRFGFKWGEKTLCPPKVLAATSTSTQENAKACVALGIQFARQVKRGRSEAPDHMIWRLKPATAAKAIVLLAEPPPEEWSCRAVAAVTGSRVWQCYISCESFTLITEILVLSSKVGKHARLHGWNSTLKITDDDRQTIKRALEAIASNPWYGSPTALNFTQITIVASDATLQRGAWVLYGGKGVRAAWKNWPWPEDQLADSIFLLELRAAVAAIMAVGRSGVVVVVIDNTAAAAVLRAMYSSTPKGRIVVGELIDFLARNHLFLVIASIAGLDNDADAPTRGDMDSPAWCETRLERTWSTAMRAVQGCERLHVNPIACSIGHMQDECDGDAAKLDPEDAACEELTSAIDGLFGRTSLE